ncbi:MAG: hypothetical protein E7E36_12065 [Veillonella sp.]|nr:hypothetical protein [Veillonella sp.]
MAKLWGGRFTKGTDKAVEDFTFNLFGLPLKINALMKEKAGK